MIDEDRGLTREATDAIVALKLGCKSRAGGKDMVLRQTVSVFEPPAKYISGKVISLEVMLIDVCVPDRLLLFLVNTLDKRVPPGAINGVVNGLDKLPRRVRSSLIYAADGYVPDSVASSRKVSAVVSGVAKYIPDRVIPPESAQNWENVKTKFHIPTLLSRQRQLTSGSDADAP